MIHHINHEEDDDDRVVVVVVVVVDAEYDIDALVSRSARSAQGQQWARAAGVRLGRAMIRGGEDTGKSVTPPRRHHLIRPLLLRVHDDNDVEGVVAG